MAILRILGVIFSLIVLIIIGLSIFILTLDPNQYKEQIVTAVKEQTGRTLDIKGDISLAIFPTLRLEIKDTTLSQPSNIQASKPFVEFDDAIIGLELMPILEGEINVTEVSLIKPHVYLISNGNTNNWSFEKHGANPKKKTSKDQAASEKQSTTSSFSISKLQIQDGVVEFEDRVTNQMHLLKDVDMSLRDFGTSKKAHLSLNGLYNPDDKQLNAVIDGDMEFSSDIEKLYFDSSKSYFDVLLKGSDIPNKELRIVYSGAMVLDAVKEQFSGTISSLKLDKNTLNGTIKLSSFSKPDIAFKLAAEELDLSPFMADEAAEASNAKSNQSGNLKNAVSPLAGLKDIKVSGELDAKMVQLDAFKLTNFKSVLGGQRGTITLEPLSFDFLGGKAEIGGLLNASEPKASYALEGVVSSLKLGELTNLLLEEASVTGDAKTEFNISMKGNTPEELTKTLSGFTKLNVAEGVISKWELSKRINQVLALLQTGSLPQSGADTLDFTSLSFDGAMNNGVFSAADLNLKSKVLEAVGSGDINLANQTINYTIVPTLGEGIAAKSSVRQVPIKISGPLNAPRYDIRVEEIVQEKAKEKINKLIDDKLGNKLDGVLGEGGAESLKKLLPF